MSGLRLGLTWRLPAVLLTMALAARTLWLSALYFTTGSAARYQVESSALAFALIGAGTVFFSRDRSPEATARAATGGRVGVRALLWCVASLALYLPALSLGLLSDDYVLAARAMEGQFGIVHAQFFRPLPLLLWSLLLHAGCGPVALHVVNALAHGTVAFLTSQVATAYVSPRLAAMAGLIVLTFPAHVEAVTWVSGVFDVLSAGFALLAVLATRELTWAVTTRRLAVGALGLAALMSKETAFVTPLLILLDQWALGRLSRRVVGDVAFIAALFGVIAVVRFAQVPPSVDQSMSRFLMQRWLFGTVGTLVVPWHSDVIARSALIPLVEVGVVIMLVTGFLVRRVRTATIRASATFALWALLATAPTIAFFFVSAELEGARYVYLATTGYAVLLVITISALPAFGRFAASAAAILLVVLGITGVRLHLDPWREAARTRDAFMAAVRNDPRTRACDAIGLVMPPDNVRGAFVFRNGVEEALRAAGTTVSSSAAPDCVLRWQSEVR